jgi:SMODS-associated and fused to various effectors sensor domain
MRSKADLVEFGRLVRSILNEIKRCHGEDAIISVFPALPVSAAIEVGRAWMPKADLPLKIFDQNTRLGGFVATLDITASAG